MLLLWGRLSVRMPKTLEAIGRLALLAALPFLWRKVTVIEYFSMGVTIAFGEFHDNICLFGYLGSKAKNSLSRARLAQEGQLKGCANPSKRGDKS